MQKDLRFDIDQTSGLSCVMSFRNWLFGAALLSFTASAAPLQEKDTPAPRIVQPGAPGQPGRVLSPAEANFPLRPPTKADIEFMQAMIVHHSQAVDMVALLLTRGSSKALQSFGKRISISQSDEVESMKQWLRERNQPITANNGHMMHHGGGMDMSKMAAGDVAVMPGMLSPNQMKALAKAAGPRFDTLFLTGMIQHHTGALDMVADLHAAGGAEQDNFLFDFVTDIDNTQRAEIKIMQNMLAKNASPRTISKDKK